METAAAAAHHNLSYYAVRKNFYCTNRCQMFTFLHQPSSRINKDFYYLECAGFCLFYNKKILFRGVKSDPSKNVQMRYSIGLFIIC